MKHSDPRKGEFTPTSLQTFLECPRKYYFQKLLHFSPKSENNAREFGAAFHEFVSTFYKFQNLPLEQRKLKAIQAFLANYDPANDSTKRNLASGLILCDRYAENYKNDTAVYKMDLVESDLVVSMANGTSLFMRVDRLLVADNFYTVVDTKTTTMALTDWFWKEFELSFQLSCYHHAIEVHCGHCDNIQIDAVKVYPLPEFQRRSLQRTENQINDFLNTYQEITNRILDTLDGTGPEKELAYFYQNPCSCSKFGGCPYLSVCKFGLTHPDVQIMFTRNQGED